MSSSSLSLNSLDAIKYTFESSLTFFINLKLLRRALLNLTTISVFSFILSIALVIVSTLVSSVFSSNTMFNEDLFDFMNKSSFFKTSISFETLFTEEPALSVFSKELAKEWK